MDNEAPPYLHTPDLREPGQGELYCFLNESRVCGPSCMAFTLPPEGPDYKDQPWSSCMLLTNAHKMGKHAVVVATSATKLVAISRANQDRDNQPPIPQVR